jgi:hypothetical protein
MNLRLLLCLSLFATAAYAGPRTSTSYSITTDTVDLGGQRATSFSSLYTNDGSAGSVIGISSVASPAETAKDGYIAQLTELVSLAVNAAPSSINQGATSQLSGTATLDDGTTEALSGSDISWSSASYPFASISNSGLLTAAANVYSNPAGSVGGTYLGATSFASVTVTGPYASSVVPDSWFVQYFGAAPNPNADPSADADHTGQTNLFKYIAGLNPLDGSRFTLTIQNVTAQPTQKQLIFQPIVAGRTYTPQFVTGLANNPTWQAVANTTQNNNGSTRTVTDLSASSPEFYRIQISFP